MNTANFVIRREEDLDTVMAVGRTLINALEVKTYAETYIGHSELYAVYQNHAIKYMMQVQDKIVKQCRAFRNGPPEATDVPEIKEALLKAGIIRESEGHNFFNK